MHCLKSLSPVKIMPSLLKIFSFSDMYRGAIKWCWQLHLSHSTNLIKIYHQKTAWAISGPWQSWNMACKPQIRLEMLVSEKVITVTRIKCMYSFTFRQLWFLVELRHWRDRCSAFANIPTCCACVQQVGAKAWPHVAYVLGEASCKCKPCGLLGALKSSSESLRLCSRNQKIVALFCSNCGEKLQNAAAEIINVPHPLPLKASYRRSCYLFSLQRENLNQS